MHLPKHWSNEETMIQYIEEINVSYVEHLHGILGESSLALVTMDNFIGQITSSVHLYEMNNIHVSPYLPNTLTFHS